MEKVVIPRFEPEVLAAMTDDGRLDDEKLSDTSIKELSWHGAKLTSRYGKAREFEAMAAMVEGVRMGLRTKIVALDCDSKADVYSVTLRPCTPVQATEIANQIETACGRSRVSHNGIFVEEASGGRIEIGPDYHFDFE
jgi:hypothetical protein